MILSRKFTGGMGDEDEEQPENDLVWKKYFLKPVEVNFDNPFVLISRVFVSIRLKIIPLHL